MNRILRAIQHRVRPLMPRMRPSFIIVGAQKAGTTTLFDLLARHPQAVPPLNKELDFFGSDDAYARGMEHYFNLFPRRPLSPRRLFTYEASPSYLYKPRAAERIARDLPNAFCVAVLRDPVKRAYSAWNMYRDFKDRPRHRHLHDPRSFEQAVRDELAGKLEMTGKRYLANSCYAPQLRRYVEHIGLGRLMVLPFTALKTDAHGMIAGIFHRIGVEPLAVDHPAFKVRSNARRYTSPLDPGLARELRAWFEPDQRELEALLGRPFDLVEPG